MLTRLTIRKFKSLDDVTVELPRLAVGSGSPPVRCGIEAMPAIATR